MSRKTRILVGAVLTVVGLTGVLAVGPSLQVTAQAGDGTSEIHERRDAMHGPGTADRIHQVPGGEEVMEQCASMMAAMGDGMMDGMMGGGMMGGGMMDGGMMDDMMGSGMMDG